MTNQIDEAIRGFSDSQKNAVNWSDGPMLLLAGPGVGKTTVLTTRLAKILENSLGKNFRILALTFTTKAADEMKRRVEALVPNVGHRTFIGTFHSFCAKILRQHGSHIGIKPDFVIYDNIDDRKEILKDALKGREIDYRFVEQDGQSWIETIDRLRKNLIGANETRMQFKDSAYGGFISEVYKFYERALIESNSQDFNGLILNACRLIKEVPMIASSYRNVYKYWFIDEFQDTTRSQYHFVKLLAASEFTNIFVVADEDQIIYQFAGASFTQMRKFRDEFDPKVTHLVENRRCPVSIVKAANALIEHNRFRISSKKSLVSKVPNGTKSIKCREFSNEHSEASGIAENISLFLEEGIQGIAVLARTKTVLKPVCERLKDYNVKASIATRRDDFVSPHFNWLLNCLELANQPSNRRILRKLTVFGNLVAGTEIDSNLIMAEPESTCVSFLEHWASVMGSEQSPKAHKLATLATELVHSQSSWREISERFIDSLSDFCDTPKDYFDDTAEDKEAWQNIYTAIHSGNKVKLELTEFLHGMKLRSKEPPEDPETVKLYTIHSSKGLEFDHVWLTGMADSILPSWQSLKGDADPQLLEEERRACFVGMTRAKKTLTLTYARSYNGYKKEPSRFLREMGLI